MPQRPEDGGHWGGDDARSTPLPRMGTYAASAYSQSLAERYRWGSCAQPRANLGQNVISKIVHTLKVDRRNKFGIVELGAGMPPLYKDPAILLLVAAFAATAFWAVLVLT
jgi:hypothetical protein